MKEENRVKLKKILDSRLEGIIKNLDEDIWILKKKSRGGIFSALGGDSCVNFFSRASAGYSTMTRENYIIFPNIKKFNTTLCWDEIKIERIKDKEQFKYLGVDWKVPKEYQARDLFEYDEIFNIEKGCVSFQNEIILNIGIDVDGKLYAYGKDGICKEGKHVTRAILPIIEFSSSEELVEFIIKEDRASLWWEKIKKEEEIKMKYNNFNEVANAIVAIEDKFAAGESVQTILKYMKTIPFLFYKPFLDQEKIIDLLDLINNGSADDDKSSMRYVDNLIMDIVIEIQNKDILKDINEYNARLLIEK